MIRRGLSFFGALALVGLTTQAWAVDLGPGGSVVPGTVANPLTETGFTTEASTSGTFSTPVESGTYSAYVVRTNTGTLDFVYQFSNNASSKAQVERISAFNFAGYTTNVGYVAGTDAGTGGAPDTADRTTDGKVVGFNFLATGVTPGSTSDIVVIATNATTWTSGTYTFQDGGATTVTAYSPGVVAATPEPSSLASAGIGGLMLFGVYRARRRLKKV